MRPKDVVCLNPWTLPLEAMPSAVGSIPDHIHMHLYT